MFSEDQDHKAEGQRLDLKALRNSILRTFKKKSRPKKRKVSGVEKPRGFVVVVV